MVSGRDGFLLFIGGLDMIFGNLLVIFGKDAYTVANATANDHAARGAPMWTGVGIIMIGLGNLIIVATRSKKKSRSLINFGSLMLNLTGVVLSSLLIGFYTWGSWSAISANPHVVIDVSVYATAILMAISIFLVSLMAMFMDCCSFALFGGYGADNYGPPSRPRYYDGHYGPPAHIYKQ
ncbi:uncharacterized protein LOC117299075 [Asterias rubens]|uniref:uncharacterized protein LOC117299075 n=1 Tax=Asterias rubens TaxID=7604 RepID=UPI00145587B1|nr:uncharacterized protein LOC117299075 [Asterias rubens]